MGAAPSDRVPPHSLRILKRMRYSRPTFRLVAAMLTLAALGACSDSDDSSGSEQSPADSAAVEAPAPDPRPPMPEPPRPPGDTASIVATIAEYSVRIEPDTIVGGDISLLIANSGARPHTIEVRGDNGMRWVSLPIRPGGGLTMTMTISPGRYVIRSTDPAYIERGLTGEFHVR